MKTLADLRDALDFANSGTFSALIDHLITCGFISKHYQWSMKTEKLARQNLYRVCDPYIRFYLKTIGIDPAECSFDGPYRQTKTTRTQGCQIDYLLQTRSKNLFLCEFKFVRL